jgi:hypothetical protein
VEFYHPQAAWQETYRRSLQKPEEFRVEGAEAVGWEKGWDRVLDDTRPPFYRWFAGAPIDACGSDIAKPSRTATVCRRLSRVHKVAPGVSRTAASKCAST